MGGRQWRRIVAVVLVMGAAAAGPGGASATTVPADDVSALDPEIVREVPGEYDTIQAAVTAASPGDLIVISPGTYAEAVDVTTDNLTIRGLDRDGVVLDGGFELQNGIRVLGADGVAVENMTAQNYTVNGFFWTGVEGYRASYVTAVRNGDYGIYAFDAVKGQIEHSYTSGSPDAGVYIGQCYPCDAVIDDVVSEHNGLGYSGTNSGGNLLIVNSTFRNNRAGIVPNSGSYELCYPERETTIVGNIVHGNQQPDTPSIPVALTAMGNGILIAGGVGNVVERNLVFDHDLYGIALAPFDETGANDDLPTREEWVTPCAEARQQAPATSIPETIFWESFDNVIRDNVIEDSRYADIGVAILTADPATRATASPATPSRRAHRRTSRRWRPATASVPATGRPTRSTSGRSSLATGRRRSTMTWPSCRPCRSSPRCRTRPRRPRHPRSTCRTSWISLPSPCPPAREVGPGAGRDGGRAGTGGAW